MPQPLRMGAAVQAHNSTRASRDGGGQTHAAMTRRSYKLRVPHRPASDLTQEWERGRGRAGAHRAAVRCRIANGDADLNAAIARWRGIQDAGRKAADIVHCVTSSVVAVAGG